METVRYGIRWQGRGRTRAVLAGVMAAAGSAAILYALAAPHDRGIPGWQPVNGALEATLAARESAPKAEDRAARVASPESASASGSQAGLPAAAPSPDLPVVPPANAQDSGLLDLNAATAEELDALPGIGPAKAKAIVAYRDSHRGFRKVEELLEVKGIGPKLYEKLRPLVMAEPSKPGG